MNGEADVFAVGVAAHADSCLIEAQACAIEGHLERAGELRSIADTWVNLVRALNGAAEVDEDE